MVTTAPYGAWPSPIDARLVAEHDGRPEYVGVVGAEVWWTEARPAEGGRRALVRRGLDGTEETVLPAPWNVRSRVIEYGGQPWAGAVDADGRTVVVFCDFADQRLYAYTPDDGAAPRPLTPVSAVGGGLRWADPVLRLDRGEVWCVLEEFTGPRPTDVRRVIAAVPLDGSAAEDRTVVRELSDDRHRFVTGPRISPDGRHAAWIAWDHPRMPWDGTVVLLAGITGGGAFTGVREFAGGPEESVAQVEGDGGRHAARRLRRRRLVELRRADPAEPDGTPGRRCARPGRRSSAVRCGRSGCAGSCRWTAARSPSCTAAVPPRSASSTRSAATWWTRPGRGRSGRRRWPCTAAG
ncbi:S9 family peptidase OS=Streptomyces rimosus subsp. rimosus (strain ATCC / DSM 40260 / JCM 4667/ NRRL 2234) OX=1265868 GN=SRIM_033520 PE=4 SV=1 [Streptomyces rimosus subsp. rimosus]